MSRPLIGVIGGMGPLATVDFLHKLVGAMPARCDQEHVPWLAWNVPQVPDRQLALAGTGESPLPNLLVAVQQLTAAGATRLVIPCNTAHHWIDDLKASTHVPFIHIVDATLTALSHTSRRGEPVGLLATRWAAQLFKHRFDAAGFTSLILSDQELREFFTPGCYAIKGNDLERGGELLQSAGECLLKRGATRLILACTEVPIALAAIHSPLLSISIDTNQALAEACIAYWQSERPGSPG